MLINILSSSFPAPTDPKEGCVAAGLTAVRERNSGAMGCVISLIETYESSIAGWKGKKGKKGNKLTATEKNMKSNKEAILSPIGKFLVKLYPVSKISVNFIFIINIMNKNKTAIAPTYITI